MKLPLDVEEEIFICPSPIHKVVEVAPSSFAMDQPIGIEAFPPPTWKWIHPKVSKPSSLVALGKSVYKIPSGAYREVVSYEKDIIWWWRKIDAKHINPSSIDFLPLFLSLKTNPIFGSHVLVRSFSLWPLSHSFD